MYFYNKQNNFIQTTYAPGLLIFPKEFLLTFYPPDKRASGFVSISDDGTTVTSCIWDEKAYQKWAEENPEQPPVEPEATDAEVLNTLLGVTE